MPHQLIRLPPPGPPQLPFERVQLDWPLVYLTLGTVFNTNVGLLRTLLAGTAALDVEVLVSTGTTVDPAVLGPQPEHVHVARFARHHQVLAAADLVVCHAGVGTPPARLHWSAGCGWPAVGTYGPGAGRLRGGVSESGAEWR